MTEIEIHAVNAPRGARLDDEDKAAAAVAVAKRRCMVATPTIAIMAVLTSLDGSPRSRTASRALQNSAANLPAGCHSRWGRSMSVPQRTTSR